MDDTFTSFPKLFADEIINTWMNSHIKVVSKLSKVINGTNETNG